MSYSRYKKHYSDCETVRGSYNNIQKTIKVMIPEGRMKKSGVRGKRFSGYEFEITDREKKFKCTFRATCQENATKQLLKQFGCVSYEFVKIH